MSLNSTAFKNELFRRDLFHRQNKFPLILTSTLHHGQQHVLSSLAFQQQPLRTQTGTDVQVPVEQQQSDDEDHHIGVVAALVQLDAGTQAHEEPRRHRQRGHGDLALPLLLPDARRPLTDSAVSELCGLERTQVPV